MEQSAQPSQPLMGVVTSAAQTAYTSPYQPAAMVTGAPAQTAYTSPYQPAAMVTGAPAQAAYTSPYQPAAMVTGAPAQAAYTSPYQPAAMVTGAPAQTAYNSPYQPAAMVTEAPAQTAYTSPYQPAAMVTGAPALIGAISPGMQMTSTYPTNPHQLAYQQIQQLHEQQQLQQHQEFQGFWAMQMADIEQTTDFKNHGLPLSRIKKIMKADEDVKMISAEAPMIFAKACEMFILELTLRSWNHTEGNKRRTLQRNDVAAAISETDVFDFLVDIIPRNELKEEGSRVASAASPAAGAQADISVPPQHQVTGAEMIMGNPADQTSTAAM